MTEFASCMSDELYTHGYFETGEGSNYVNYGDDPGWIPTVQVMRQFTPHGATVYEVASAKGWFLSAALHYGFEALGIDISRYAVSAAPDHVKPYLSVKNATNLPWADESADAVCSWEFLEHVPESEIIRVLQEMERVLKPGGRLWHRIGIDMEGEADPSNQCHDVTHVLEKPALWWHELMVNKMGWEHDEVAEGALDMKFLDRDWCGRFFVFKKPVKGD